MNEKQITVAAQVARLSTIPMAELWSLWDEHHPRRPARPNRAYLESRLAYKIQEAAFGGLSAVTRARLEAIGAKHSKIKVRARPQEFYFAPGTKLVREWAEHDHTVVVTADGLFDYQGKTFKSLTAVARHITGTHWSGPKFFGLKKESL